MKKILLLITVLLLLPIAFARVGTEKAYNPLISSKLDMIFSGDMNGENLDLKGSNLTNVSYINPDGQVTYFGGNVSTEGWFFGSINWSDVQNKFITAVDDIYIYMSGTTATFNETKLNNSIDTRSILLNVNSSTYWDEETSQGDLNVNSSTYWDGGSTNYLGSDCSESDGDLNRTLTVTGATLIIVDNQFLHPNIDYILVGTTSTFLNEIWDQQKITVWN